MSEQRFDPANLPDGEYETGQKITVLDDITKSLGARIEYLDGIHTRFRRNEMIEIPLTVIVRNGKAVGFKDHRGVTHMWPSEINDTPLPPIDFPPFVPPKE